MSIAKVMLLALVTLLLGSALTAQAADITSAFVDFTYSYTLTPAPGEDIRSFHVYTGLSECDAGHYYDLVMPAGWFFDTVPMDDKCVLTWWTEGDPLPVGVTADFGYVHYCAPCCHSWYVSEPGTSDPNVPVIDDDTNHAEPCNIPAAWAGECGGPGTVVAPIFPVGIPADGATWGSLKTIYR